MKKKIFIIFSLLFSISLFLVSCGTSNTEDVEKEKCTHEYGKWSVDAEPTLTNVGSLKRICSLCSDEEKYELPILSDKDYSIGIVKNSTCLEEGVEIYHFYELYDSFDGGQEFEFEVTTKPLGHDDDGTGHCERCYSYITNEIYYELAPTCDYYIVIGFQSANDNKNVVIPESYNGLPVKEIDIEYDKVHNENSIEKIIIPNSIEKIDLFWLPCAYSYNEYDNAYYLGNDENPYLVLIKPKSKDITSCTVNENTRFIKQSAFESCSSLTNITIPESVTSIGKSAFHYCPIEYANIPTIAIPYIQESSSSDSKIKEVVINSGESISDDAFSKCNKLTSITIPESVKTIGARAFSGCSSLTNITIPLSLKSIGEDAFWGCSSLKLNQYDNAYYIGSEAFPYTVLIKAISKDITKCEISGQTRHIYDNAFEDCTKLTKVTIQLTNFIGGKGSYYSTIGREAFSGCSSLESVTIPSSITSIGEDAFYKCSSLKFNEYKNGYYLPITYGGFLSVDYGFLYDLKVDKDIESLTIHKDTKIVNHDLISFYGYQIDLYDKLSSVYYEGSFEDYCNIIYCNECSNPMWVANHFYIKNNNKYEELTSIEIPDSITSIGNYQFYGWNNLTSVTIPSSVTYIGKWAFKGCSSLKSVKIPDGVTSVEEGTFYNCNSLMDVKLSNNTKSINKSAFYNCYNITSIVLPSSLTYIFSYNDIYYNNIIQNNIIQNPFYGCYKLKEVFNYSRINLSYYSSSYGNVYVGYATRYANKVHRSIYDKESYIITSGDYQFIKTTSGDYYLINYIGNDTSITLPDNINGNSYSLYKYAFASSSLESVTIPNTITSIADYAFYNCKNLTNITMPNSVTSIEDYAFGYCRNLTSITIPNSVTSIGKYAFYYCENLTSITILASLKSIGYGTDESIGDNVFEGCSKLENVYYNGTIEDWSKIEFAYGKANPMRYASHLYVKNAEGSYEKVIEIEISDSVTELYEYSWTHGLRDVTSIIMPSSISKIGNYTFLTYTSLKTVYYVGDAASWKKINIGSGNTYLTSATIYYYSEEEPTTEGYYWHYVDGVPTVWE